MRHFGISSSCFKSLRRDLMKIENFGNMIGREMEAKIKKYGEFAPSNLRDLNFTWLN